MNCKTINVLLLLLLFVYNNELLAQNRMLDITGLILDDNNQPIIGASIYVEGTQSGVSSEIDGTYKLNANLSPGNYNLMATFIGYKSQSKPFEVNAGSGSSINIDFILQEDFLKLDEVIVTGSSGATAKKNLGNAISTLDSRALENNGATGVDQALAGKLSGALINQNSGNPAGGISVTLRGNSTVLGSSDPLYIVDGVIMDNSSLELIDLGGYTQNRLVDLNPSDIDRIEVIKGAAAAAIYGSRASNGVVQIFTKRGKSGKPVISFNTAFNINQIRKKIVENNESFAFEAPGNASNENLIPTQRYNMQDLIFRTGFGTSNNLSISGGNENTRYYMSGSYLKNQGIVDNSDYNRITGRVNLDQIINPWLSVSGGLNYIKSFSSEVPNGGLAAVYGALTGMNFNNNNYNPHPDEDGNYISPAGFVPNPLEVINTFDFGQSTDRIMSNFLVKLTPFTGFSTEFILGLDNYTQEANGFIPIGSTTNPTGWTRTALATRQLLNADLNLRYVFDPLPRLNSITQLGFTAQNDQLKSLSITADKLSPVVNSTDGGTVIGRSDNFAERNIEGAFVQQTLGFDEKLFLTGAIRLDAASTFGEDERTQFYPKVSLAYVLSEDWKVDPAIISSLKLRFSYGESGNLTALSAYERFSNYNPVPINGQTGLVPTARQGNPNLKPERQKELEFGFDMAMLNDKLGLEFSFYDVKVRDLLLTRTLAPSTGFETRLENVGNMTNKGFELLLRNQTLKSGQLIWNNTLIWSRNRNEVDGIEGGFIALPKSFGVSVARNGEPLGVLDGFYFARDNQGQILLDANGLPSRAVNESGAVDRKTIGDPNPDWTGSWNSQLSYNQWSFTFQLDAVQGFEVFNFTDRVNSRSTFGGGEKDAMEIRGELPRGYNNAAYNIWERFIEDGSFVKLREISLGYNLPANKVFSGLSFHIIGRNLISFDDYSGWDPETSASGQTNGVRGFDFNEVPIPKVIQFSINAKF